MTQDKGTAVDRHFAELLMPAVPVLEAALDDSTAAGLATAVQTVGSKSYDGFALALVVADR